MPPTVQAVWDRAIAEWRRGAMMGRREPSFIRVTLDEWSAWVAFIRDPDPLNTRACGQMLVLVQ